MTALSEIGATVSGFYSELTVAVATTSQKRTCYMRYVLCCDMSTSPGPHLRSTVNGLRLWYPVCIWEHVESLAGLETGSSLSLGACPNYYWKN